MTMLLALFLVVSPIEQSYGPYTRPVNGGDAAVAPARGGALLAWSEAYRIRIALLDSRAQLISEIHELPASATRAFDIAPAAAFDGESFLIAWNERLANEDQTWAIFADSRGTPIGTPRKYGSPAPISVKPTPKLVWDGVRYRMWNGRNAFVIARDGAIVSSVAAAAPEGAAAANDLLGISASKITYGGGCGGPLGGLCNPYHTITWSAGARSGQFQVTQGSPVSPSTIAPAGDAFIVAWATPQFISYLATNNGINHYIARSTTEMAPGLACDDAQCVLAYSQSGDVHALVFPPDRLPGPEQLTIAASERDERAPQVFVLAPGRFLITYRSDGADGARLNGRLVTFANEKRRAVR